MSGDRGIEGLIGLIFVFVAPVLALAFALYHTRSQPPLAAARDTAGIAGGLSVVCAIALESLTNAGSPDSSTLYVLLVAAIPLIPRLLLAGTPPRREAMVLAIVVCAAMSLVAILAGLLLGFVGSIAEPQNQSSGGAYLLAVPVGCFVWLQVKTVGAIITVMGSSDAQEPTP